MERVHISKMPLYRDHTRKDINIVTHRVSGYRLSDLIADLNFEQVNVRGQVRLDKAKKAVLRALCDRYPMVHPGEKNIRKKSGYSVAQIRRVLRELEHVDKLIVDVNSRITWRKPTAQEIESGHPAHKLVRECDNVGKKGGRGPGCTPQYHIFDRKIYDAYQQQKNYERIEKQRKAETEIPVPLLPEQQMEVACL